MSVDEKIEKLKGLQLNVLIRRTQDRGFQKIVFRESYLLDEIKAEVENEKSSIKLVVTPSSLYPFD